MILHVVEKEIVEAYKEAFVWAGKDVTTETEKLDEKMRKQMEEDIKELEGLGFSVKRLITILKVAESEDVSLIVMGSHGCGRLSCELEKLIGSTTENVVRYAKKPVLVVR